MARLITPFSSSPFPRVNRLSAMAPNSSTYSHPSFTMMTKILLLCSLFSVARGASNHYLAPQEDNVFSPEKCLTNQDGFGGDFGAGVFTVEYVYEMKLVGDGKTPTELDEIMFTIERSVADFLLQTNFFKDLPCNRRRAERKLPSHIRKLVDAIGITTNPKDDVTGFDCETEPEEGNSCEVVYGAFQVYTVQANSAAANSKATTGLSNGIKTQLRLAMKNGAFDDSHEDIVEVIWVDELEADRGTGDGASGPNDNQVPNSQVQNSSTAVIIGASVGAVLVLGALAFYRRRQTKSDDDETFTQPGGSSSA